jgi:hypothetical protein
MKGAAGTGAGGEVLATPAEVKAKAIRTLKLILLLQVVWFGCFIAGGVLVLQTAWHNNHLPAACSSPIRSLAALLLALLGIAGLLVTGYVATRLAVRYLGEGAMAFLRGGRGYGGPTGPRPGAHDMGGGFPLSFGGSLPGAFDSDPPPEPPGSQPERQ